MAAGYEFVGFAQPVDNGSLNVAMAGRAIPLKWQVLDASGAPVTDLGSAQVTSAVLDCASGASQSPVSECATGNSGLQNLGDGCYQWNWATSKSYAGSCRTLSLSLGDGATHTAAFEFSG